MFQQIIASPFFLFRTSTDFKWYSPVPDELRSLSCSYIAGLFRAYDLRHAAEGHVLLVGGEADRPGVPHQQHFRRRRLQRERRLAALLAVGTGAIVGQQHASEELREALRHAEIAGGALRGGGGLKRQRSEALPHAGEVRRAGNIQPKGAFAGRGGGAAATAVRLGGKGETWKRWCSGD